MPLNGLYKDGSAFSLHGASGNVHEESVGDLTLADYGDYATITVGEKVFRMENNGDYLTGIDVESEWLGRATFQTENLIARAWGLISHCGDVG